MSSVTRTVPSGIRPEKALSHALIYGLLALGGLTMIVPFVFMLSASLKTGVQVYRFPPEWIPNPVQWSNYPEGLEVLTARAFFNTVFFTASIVLGQGLVTTMGGYAFARLRFPFREQLFLAYIGTMMIPGQVTLIPAYIMVVRLGWQDSYQGLIVPILAGGAFGTFVFRQFFKQIPEDLADAARIDGANHWTVFWRIFLPLSKPALTAYGVITALHAWNMFLWPIIIIQSRELWVLTMALNILQGQLSGNLNILMAAVSLSMLPLFILYLFGQRFFVEGVTMSGLKG